MNMDMAMLQALTVIGLIIFLFFIVVATGALLTRIFAEIVARVNDWAMEKERERRRKRMGIYPAKQRRWK